MLVDTLHCRMVKISIRIYGDHRPAYFTRNVGNALITTDVPGITQPEKLSINHSSLQTAGLLFLLNIRYTLFIIVRERARHPALSPETNLVVHNRQSKIVFHIRQKTVYRGCFAVLDGTGEFRHSSLYQKLKA